MDRNYSKSCYRGNCVIFSFKNWKLQEYYRKKKEGHIEIYLKNLKTEETKTDWILNLKIGLVNSGESKKIISFRTMYSLQQMTEGFIFGNISKEFELRGVKEVNHIMKIPKQNVINILEKELPIHIEVVDNEKNLFSKAFILNFHKFKEHIDTGFKTEYGTKKEKLKLHEYESYLAH